MYRYLERRLVEHLREFLRRAYALEIAHVVVEQPPKIEFGEYALPIAFELARTLRKAPRKIAAARLACPAGLPSATAAASSSAIASRNMCLYS